MDISLLSLLMCSCVQWIMVESIFVDKLTTEKVTPKTNTVEHVHTKHEIQHDHGSVTIKKLTDNSKTYNSNCCKNGGRCILGSFCHCPKNFYGRFCEYRYMPKPCDSVGHGSWVISDCSLCRCFSGNFLCVPKLFNGCDEDGEGHFDPNQKIEPMKGKDINIFPDEIGKKAMKSLNLRTQDYYEYADYYDEDTSDNVNVNNGMATTFSGPHLTLIIFTSLILISI